MSPFIYYEAGCYRVYQVYRGFEKVFPCIGRKKFLKGPVNPVNLVTGEPESRTVCRVCRVCRGKSVQGVQVCTGFFQISV